MKKLDSRGFTLLEMLVVIFIIGLLLLIVLPNINKQRSSAEAKANEALKSTIETQVQLYTIDEGSYPASLDVLQSGGYLTDDQIKKANTANITYDANSGTVILNNAQ